MNSVVLKNYIKQSLQSLIQEIEPMLEAGTSEYIERDELLAHGKRAMLHLKALSYAIYEGLDYGEAGTMLDEDKGM